MAIVAELAEVVAECDGNQSEAARRLGLVQQTLHRALAGNVGPLVKRDVLAARRATIEQLIQKHQTERPGPRCIEDATRAFEDALEAYDVAGQGATPTKVYHARRLLIAETRLLVRAFDARIASLEEKAGVG